LCRFKHTKKKAGNRGTGAGRLGERKKKSRKMTGTGRTKNLGPGKKEEGEGTKDGGMENVSKEREATRTSQENRRLTGIMPAIT